jgi:hypothetical protein
VAACLPDKGSTPVHPTRSHSRQHNETATWKDTLDYENCPLALALALAVRMELTSVTATGSAWWYRQVRYGPLAR